MFRFGALGLVSLLVLGCGLEESSPVPQPVPFQIRQSTPGEGQATRLLVGLDGAVAGVGQVRARGTSGTAEAVVPSMVSGSFSVVVAASGLDPIELRFETAAGVSEPLILQPPVATRGPFLQGAGARGVVSAPDGQGRVTVTNDAGAGQPARLQASPSSDLLVSNAGTGQVVVTTTDSAGLFTVQIPAQHGDPISLLLVSPGSSAATSDYLTFSVP